MYHLNELGLRVPDDISILGFDDIPLCRYTNPPLTTVAQDFESMGRQTVHKIINIIEKHKKEELFEQLLPTQIISRQSVKMSVNNPSHGGDVL
jgi:DNA-binding LacI/PurR family transcriptional regulator